MRGMLALCRVSNLPTVWTNALAGLVLSGAVWGVGDALLVGGALSCLYSAGMALNDYWDAPLDRIANPRRPIPSGLVTPSAALRLVVALFAAALTCLLPVAGHVAWGLALGLVAAIVAYDRSHKASGWSVLLMALCRGLAVLVAGAVVAESIAPSVIWAASAQALYVLALTAVARWRARWPWAAGGQVVPILIAGISLLDGVLMAVFVAPVLFLVGALGACLTLAMNRFWVSGD